jgi:hypothetical protein
MGYEDLTPWLEVSWGMSNVPHGDDQVLVVKQADIVALILADGVATSTVGRCASALLTYHIGRIFEEKSQDLDRQHLESVERFMRTVVLEAVEKTREEMNALSEHIELGEPPPEDEPPEDGQLQEAFESVIEALGKIKEHRRKQYMVLGINPDKDRNIKILDYVLEWLEKKEQELTMPLKKPELATPPREQELATPLSTRSSTGRLQEIVEQLPKGCDETDQKVMERLYDGLSKQNPQDWNSTTTLCFALLFPEEHEDHRVTRMVTLSLGDSQITILSPERLWVKHYEVRTAQVTTFVSTKNGIVGTADVASRVLYPGECVVLSSDGANTMWTTPAGVEGVPFHNLIDQHIKGGSFRNFAESWLDYMRSNNALTDDASLIVARVVDNEAHAEE